MLIIAFGLMGTILLVFLIWNFCVKCRDLWLAHKKRHNRRGGNL